MLEGPAGVDAEIGRTVHGGEGQRGGDAGLTKLRHADRQRHGAGRGASQALCRGHSPWRARDGRAGGLDQDGPAAGWDLLEISTTLVAQARLLHVDLAAALVQHDDGRPDRPLAGGPLDGERKPRGRGRARSSTAPLERRHFDVDGPFLRRVAGAAHGGAR